MCRSCDAGTERRFLRCPRPNLLPCKETAMTTATYRHYSGTAAELYQSFFVPSIATPVSAELLRTAALQPGTRVLDVACGTGVVTRAAAELIGPTGSVTGI